MNSRAIFTIPIIAALVVSSVVTADIYMSENRHTDGYSIAGKTVEAVDEKVTYWVGEQGMKMESDSQIVLIKPREELVYVMDPIEEKYVEIPFSIFQDGAGASENGESGELPPEIRDMMRMDISVTPTGKTQTVNGWKAKGYTQKISNSMMTVVSELWATNDLDVDKSVFQKYYTAIYGLRPGMQEMMGNLVEEMKKIDGIVVKSSTTTEVMGTKITSSARITQVEERSAPQGAYEIPDGYEKEELNV